MLSYKDLENEEIKNTDLSTLEKSIDESMKRFHGWYPWEYALIEGEIPVSVRDTIAKMYISNAGWKYVYHVTSSEHDEKGGLTSFYFSNTIIDHIESKLDKYHKISSDTDKKSDCGKITLKAEYYYNGEFNKELSLVKNEYSGDIDIISDKGYIMTSITTAESLESILSEIRTSKRIY